MTSKQIVNCVCCDKRIFECGNIKLCNSCWVLFDIFQLRMDVSNGLVTFGTFHGDKKEQIAYMFHNRTYDEPDKKHYETTEPKIELDPNSRPINDYGDFWQEEPLTGTELYNKDGEYIADLQKDSDTIDLLYRGRP